MDPTALEQALRADRMGDEYDRFGNDAMALACWETAAELYESAGGDLLAARPQLGPRLEPPAAAGAGA